MDRIQIGEEYLYRMKDYLGPVMATTRLSKRRILNRLAHIQQHGIVLPDWEEGASHGTVRFYSKMKLVKITTALLLYELGMNTRKVKKAIEQLWWKGGTDPKNYKMLNLAYMHEGVGIVVDHELIISKLTDLLKTEISR